MTDIFLALGTNLGDRKKQIEKAIAMISDKIKIIRSAPIYETKPVGFRDQENFYNTVIKAQTELNPEELFTFVKSIEKRMGRKKRFPNGPREIDIDILLFNNYILNSENLQIPHPRMHERDFVLQPLSDIALDLVHPVYKKTVRQLLDLIKNENLSIVAKVN